MKTLCLLLLSLLCVPAQQVMLLGIYHGPVTNRDATTYDVPSGLLLTKCHSNHTWTAYLRVSGTNGTYRFLWDYDLDRAKTNYWTNFPGNSFCIEGHNWLWLNEPFTKAAGDTYHWVPIPPNSPAAFIKAQRL